MSCVKIMIITFLYMYIELDIVGSQFKLQTVPLLCDLGCCSRTVVVIKLRQTSALQHDIAHVI